MIAGIEIGALREGKFSLQLFSFQLFDELDNGADPVLTGNGTIRQDTKRGTFTARLHYACADFEGFEVLSLMGRTESSLRLEGVSTDNRIWIANDVFCEKGSRMFEGIAGEVKLEFRRLEERDRNEVRHRMVGYFEFRFFSEARLPLSLFDPGKTVKTAAGFHASYGGRAYQKLELCNVEITITHDGDLYFVDGVGIESLDEVELFCNRFLEAAQFGLGQPLQWSSVECFEEKRLVSRINPRSRKLVWRGDPRPLLHHPNNGFESKGVSRDQIYADFWIFLQKYVEETIEYTSTPRHPLFQMYHPILISQLYGSIEQTALFTSVAVERLAKQACNDDGPTLSDQGVDAKELLKVEHAIESLGISSGLLSRVKGLLSLISSPSVPACLAHLSQRGNFSMECVLAWRPVRNFGAHGELEHDDIEGYLDNSERVRHLFHVLLLRAVGYEGSMIDYSGKFPVHVHMERLG